MEGAHRATGIGASLGGQDSIPDPEVPEKKPRRNFTASYKLRILQEVENCNESGGIGRILRREGLYSSNLADWRKARDKGLLNAMAPRKRGRKSKEKNPLATEVARLQKEKSKLEHKLKQAELIIEAQKKNFSDPGNPTKSGRPQRRRLMNAALTLSYDIGKKPSCEAFGVPRSSFYRFYSPKKHVKSKRGSSPLSLNPDEQQTVLDILHSDTYRDQAPYQVYASLLDKGEYYCSIRTMYRLLHKEHGSVPERRRQVNRPKYKKTELLATGPNQVWSWDITKLKSVTKWTYFYLYVIMDIFSRYVVGWMVAHREQTALAKRLIEKSCENQNILPGQLGLHADRGASMKSKGVAQLLVDLGVTKTHSRPHVSNDNPYSEAQFKTLKYCPKFPNHFGSIEDTRAFCQDFFGYYNKEHYHSGIGLVTPEQFHYGIAKEIYGSRCRTLKEAFIKNPIRFKGKIPRPPALPEAAWINKPEQEEKDKIGA
ncbi:MAG: IS3 family transposase [Desulfobacter sp.]|nr:IS3 family transposase [Desulfobacter sp.]